MRCLCRFRVVLCLSVVFLIGAAAPSVASFSTPGSLPGGVATTDTDTGSGERWGRAGGRDMTFAVNSPNLFGALHWGVMSATVPTVALDGTLTPNTAEYLTFSPSESDFTAGVARWKGSSTVVLYNGSMTVQTRFTLTVTRDALPVPLISVTGGVSPGIDVLAAGSSFKANLLFEGLDGTTWRPILDYYDALRTPPGNPPGTSGPALTAVMVGFYYENVDMRIEDHDRNVTARLSSIKDDTAFLRIDTVNRLAGISGQVDAGVNNVNMGIGSINNNVSNMSNSINGVSNGINQLQQQIANLNIQVPSNIATRENLSELQNMLLILWGLMPCPPNQNCTGVKFIQSLSSQASVDALAAAVADVKAKTENVQSAVSALQGSLDAALRPDHLDVLVTETDAASKKRRFIVQSSSGGVLTNGVVTRILAIRTDTAPATVNDVTHLATIVPLSAVGLNDVTLDLVKDISDAAAYQFEVRLGDGSVRGNGLVNTVKKTN